MTIDPYKNFKHIKAFKEHDDDAEDAEDSVDSRVNFFPFKCKYCNEHYDLVYDELHGEIICKKCGHVIQCNVLL